MAITESATRVLTVKEAISEALHEEMVRDKRVILLGEDIQDPAGGVFKVTLGFSTEFGPERVRATPISEMAIVGASVGAALAGLRPVAEIMLIDFLGVCIDQIYNHAAKLRFMSGGQVSVPLVIRTESGGGASFGAQHSQSLEAWLCHVPGIKVVMPSTPSDAKGLMIAAIRDDDPVVFIENMFVYQAKGDCPRGEHLVPIGKAAVRRAGSDCTIVAWGRMALEAPIAAEELAAEGIECEVIDPRSLVPLDVEGIVTSVRKTGHLVVAHEAVERGGYGGEIAALVQERAWDRLKGPILRVGAMSTPIPYAHDLEFEMLPQRRDIVAAVRKAVGSKPRQH